MATVQRRRGRPRLDPTDGTKRTSVMLPTRQYDRLCRQALREDRSVADVIRRQLDRHTKADAKK
jgi:hypothetical protein